MLAQDTKQVLSLGELVELWLVFPVSVVVVLTALDRELSETCVEAEECLHQQKLTATGTAVLTSINADMLSAQQLLPAEFQLL
jgi:hypothetical protein